jgi:phage repressor protein C with HTH and peptisase S24 domain
MKKIENNSLSWELFKKALRANKLNIRKFALKAGIGQSTVYNWENVKNVKDDESIEAIERILGVKYEDLCVPAAGELTTNVRPVETTTHSEEYDHNKEWPVIGSTRGGPWLETLEESEYPGISDDRVQAPEGVKDENGFALTVEGDSMAPEFPAGCRILVSPNTQPQPGQYAVVIAKTPMGNRESCFKKVFPGKTSDTLTLRSLNPAYQDIVIPKSDIIRILPVVASEVTVRKVFVPR